MILAQKSGFISCIISLNSGSFFSFFIHSIYCLDKLPLTQIYFNIMRHLDSDVTFQYETAATGKMNLESSWSLHIYFSLSSAWCPLSFYFLLSSFLSQSSLVFSQTFSSCVGLCFSLSGCKGEQMALIHNLVKWLNLMRKDIHVERERDMEKDGFEERNPDESRTTLSSVRERVAKLGTFPDS